MNRTLIALASLLMLLCAPAAGAQSKGMSIFAIEFTDGSADLADQSHGGGGYIRSYRIPEIGVQAQYWRLMADDYALTLSGGAGFSSERNEPGSLAPIGAQDQKLKTSSFNVRLGGDRIVRVGVRALMYGGPGIEFWSGKAKYDLPPSFEYEGKNTNRISLSTRIGAIMMLGDNCGLTSHVGHRLGHASVEEGDAKAGWWPSSFEGSMGVAFLFGKKQQ
jgi:hypothetical protein